jgi:hypothetical protein
LKDTARRYGIKIIGGEFYAGYFKTAEEDATDYYVEIGQTDQRGFVNVVGLDKTRSIMMDTTGDETSGVYGRVRWFDNVGDNLITMRIQYTSGTHITKDLLISSQTGIELTAATGEKIGLGPHGGAASFRGLRFSPIGDHVDPYADDDLMLGSNTKRWGRIYAHYVTTGDLCFAEKSCPMCGEAFEPGDVLCLLVQHIDDDSTYTIPIHDRCKGLPAEFEIEIPERETRYSLNERGGTEAYMDAAYEEMEEEIIIIHPGYVLEEKTGKFLRKNSEENAQYFDRESLEKCIVASRETALTTDTVLRRKPKYKRTLLKVN